MRTPKELFGRQLNRWLKTPLILAWLWISCQSAIAQAVIEPVRKIDDNALKIIDGTSYCSAGYGITAVQVELEGEKAYNDEQPNPYVFGNGLSDIPALTLECTFNRMTVDWIFWDDTIRLSRELVYQNSAYNTVALRHNALSVGYSFPLIAHDLRLDFGLGYSMTHYSLAYFDETISNSRERTDLKSSGWLFHSKLKYYVSPNIFVYWMSHNSLGKDLLVHYYGQVGLSFLVKL